MDLTSILTNIAVGVAGLALGALVNRVVARLPRERGLGGPAHCTRCGRALAWWQQLPLIGWLAQGGRGRCCGRPLHWIFPLNELLVAAALVLFHLRYGLTTSFFYLAFVALVLVLTGAIDWLHRSIYTFVILGAALATLAVSFAIPHHSFLNALLGALLAGFVFAIFFALARLLFPSTAVPFGLGDVYLAIFIGAALGLLRLMPAIFYGMVLAGLFSLALLALRAAGRPNVPQYISYGSFLCLGALAYLVAWGLN
ncbi:prepilin peptidase [Kouleothrix sp.]|uniref:prepilin peptidase n=1 Tax=Kouleothrix sp. TaxID=2779161 RepID=UPI00391948BD